MLKRAHKIKKMADDCIINDSGSSLTEDQLSVLCKGLRFVPNNAQIPDIHEDLSAFRRSVNLRLHFTESYRSSKLGKILKSSWEPPEYLTEAHCTWRNLRSKLKDPVIEYPRHNLTPGEKQAWKDLEGREDIFIIKADKGGKIVLWKREDYLKEADRQLADDTTYREVSALNYGRLERTMSGIKAQLTQRLLDEKCITFSEADRMRNWEGSPAKFYLMPKVHKGKREDTGTYAGRPVVASCSAILRPFDEYLSALTAGIGKCFPGTLQDTTALIQALDELGPVPAGSVLFSADVESLYPSIPWGEGIEAAARFYEMNLSKLKMEARKDGHLPPPSPELFKSILSSVITMNVFSFQSNRFFRQIKGTAMGCSISVFFANAFLYHRTAHLIERPPQKLLFLKRYIDDLIAVWAGQEEEITGIFKDVVDDSIKLTYVTSLSQLEALDLQLFFGPENQIFTRLYTKPTGGALFIPWNSGHPQKSKKGIVFSQLLRLRRNCTLLDDFYVAAKKLTAVFKDRGYHPRFLQETLEKVATLDRSSLFKKKEPRGADSAVFTTTFHPSRPRLLREPLNDFWKELQASRLVAERYCLAGVPKLPANDPLVAFRLPKALGYRTGVPYKNGQTKQIVSPSSFTRRL